MRKVTAAGLRALMAMVLVAGAATAQVQSQLKAEGGKLKATELAEIRVKVEAVDLATREVRIRHEDGVVETIKVSDSVQRLGEVKPGDDVLIKVYHSLTLKLAKRAGAGPAEAEVTSEIRNEATELPGGIKTREIAVVAKVTAIDAAKSTVTLTGPKGNAVPLEVEKDVLAKVKVGDLVDAVYTEALAVSISRANGK